MNKHINVYIYIPGGAVPDRGAGSALLHSRDGHYYVYYV